jgi:predicted O-methyltransferase YrrM
MPGKPQPMVPPFEPLLCDNAHKFLRDLLQPDWAVFEWGSGESTAFFAERVASVVSVEHDKAWKDAVEAVLYEHKLQAQVLLLPEKLMPCAISSYPDQHFDLVFVDGLDRTRVQCCEQAMPKVKPGGWLVLDDSQWKMLAPARKVLAVWRSISADGLKLSWKKNKRIKTRTTFYRRPW